MNQYPLSLIFSVLALYANAVDSVTVVTYDGFMQQVMEHHPAVFRANLLKESGESRVLQARGSFDPRLSGSIQQKYFQNNQYYSHINSGLVIPTWFGVSAEAGYISNDGIYLNPERMTPDPGLWYAGIRLELGNGLIIDQRRAELEKAKINMVSSEIEQQIVVNELRRDAAIAFWKWQQAYRELNVSQQARNNAMLRLEAVRSAAIFGDRPYIDTVEASMVLQKRELSLVRAQNTFKNAELYVEFFLWSEGFIPLELENAVPETDHIDANFPPLQELDSLLANHPFMRIYELKLEQQRVDLKLKREQLKPIVTLKYNAINEPVNGNPLAEYSPANYTWGASFSYPLLSRNARGSVRLEKIKIQDQELKIKLNTLDLENKIRAALNNYVTARNQVEISKQLVEQNETMYNAERSLFELGESSVFMINSRESAWLSSRLENIEVEITCLIAYTELNYLLMLEY